MSLFLRSSAARLLLAVTSLLTGFAPLLRAADTAVADLPAYSKISGEVAGSLKCEGSDTMNNLVALWAEGFKKYYPSVREGIKGKGSASAPPALTEGTC